MSIADGFHWFVYGYGNTIKLGEYYLANFDSPILSSIIALISQGVYCWRIRHLSHWKISPFFIAFVSDAFNRSPPKAQLSQQTSCCQVIGGFGIGIAVCRLSLSLAASSPQSRTIESETGKHRQLGRKVQRFHDRLHPSTTISFWDNSFRSSGPFAMP